MDEELNGSRTGEQVGVSCYAGYKADERPITVTWRGRTFIVTGILDRWYDRDAGYFKVQVDDGGQHLLRHDLDRDIWERLLPRKQS